ncbi:MAG: TonB-dependent receptor [Acidobacteria bacterium]|nr:TonB-dependent receptor [Acidobacteriota bacterium]
MKLISVSKPLVRGLVFGACLILFPATLQAQGTIAGQVTDSSGSVVPGVTIEASSPALIEGARTTVTDTQGRYQIADLRPGTYKVTFTLAGFRTVVREGIELTAGFTATLNTQMAVGTIEETVTVAGESPIIDVSSVTTQTVMTREVLDVVPTGRNIQAIGILIPGTGLQVGGGAAYSVDVGGSGGMQQSPLAYHGNTNSVQQVDGIRFNNLEGAGQYSGMYWNDGMIQEIQYTTSGDSAETQAGGVRINMIPKEGGNTFRGTVFTNFTFDKWHGNNLDQRLKDRGLQSVGKIKQIWDFNPSIGGPIVRNKLWFHFAFRNWGVNRTVPGSFSEIDPAKPSIDDSYINSAVLRLTWQVNQKHKFSAHYDRNHKYRGHWGLASNVSEEAAAIEDMPQSFNASAKWTATLTNRLLAQAGLGLYTQQYREIYRPELPTQPGQAVHTFPLTNTRYDPYFTNFDESTGFFRGAFRSGNIYHISEVRNYSTSLSYVTGSQSLKVGLQFQEGQSRQSDLWRGDITRINWNSGRPRSVILRASPRYAIENIRDLGLYVDDRWMLGRVTLSGGIRYDYFNGYAPEQYSEAGTWIGARLTPKVENIPNWSDINPRLGVSWDLFGNAKTALKFTMGRYVNQVVAGPTRQLNPMRQISETDTRSWNDANGNLRPELNELGPTSNRAFGTVVQTIRFDPEYVDGFGAREGHWNYHVSLQHELRPGLGVTATYTYVTNFNQLETDNLLITPGDFDEFTIGVPDDPRLPANVRGQTITGLYVIKDAARPLVNNFRSFASKFGGRKDTYNGADFNVNWRMGNGGTLAGGLTWGDTHTNDCYVVDNPTQLRFCDRRVDPNLGLVRGGVQIKLLGAYPVVAGWHLSGSFQSVRGPNITAAWTSRDFNGTIRFPNSTRTNLGATPSITVQLIEPGTLYDDRLYQVDLRGTRVFGIGARRVRLMVDLYNAFYNNAVLQRNIFGLLDTYGPAWGRPLSILEGRLFKVGVQLDF